MNKQEVILLAGLGSCLMGFADYGLWLGDLCFVCGSIRAILFWRKNCVVRGCFYPPVVFGQPDR